VFRGKHDDDLTFDSERKLQDVIEKLEGNLPQEVVTQQTVQEQEDEHGI
jgi:hypothetical protein